MDSRTSPVAANRRDRRARTRHGVSSVLAMMFLVIFSSLAAAMAVVAQGNLRTADSYLKVSRAMSAAETGLVFAQRRLASESSRFVVKKGVIDKSYGDAMWDGSYDAADVEVLPPSGFTELAEPVGVAEALLNAHLEDLHTFLPDPGELGDANLPEIDQHGTLRAAPTAMMADPDGLPLVDGPYFRLTYQPYVIPGSDDSYILVTSVGYDQNVTRTLQMVFQIDKKIEFAIIAPSRIMIGKNVRIEGPLGTVYGTVAGELITEHGDPLVIRSDFYYLHDDLNDNLDIFFTQLAIHDADGDGRLRLYHPTEQVGIAVDPAVMADTDGNEYVDDFDLFLAHYDVNPTDGRVVYSAALSGETEEFTDDNQLARLIDEGYPDRDGDGFPATASDTSLGWSDGVLDIMDTYAKVRGRLAFSVARADWELGHGDSYQTVVQGPITPGLDEAPVHFEAPEDVLRLLDTSMFDTSATWYESQVPVGSADFDAQAAAGGTYIPPAGLGDPAAINWESIPLDAQGAYDHYDRPIYRDMTFTNVRIPMGNNGLYENCTFIGVTFIECEPDCTDDNWNYAGALTRVESPLSYELKFTQVTELSDGTVVLDSKVMSNNIRFDSCTFIGTISGTKPGVLPDDNPYTHWRNKIQLTGATRFYIEADDPDLLAEAADNPILVAQIQAIINGMAQSDLDELRKSSILLPGWSADIGSFTNEQDVDPELTPKVKLKGTIVAGILDVRGTADVHGTLLMTFQPTAGEGPLSYGGLTDAFNTTIGYFGPADGDGEGTDDVSAGFGELTLRYDPDADLPDGIPWPIRIDPDPVSYTEGGGL